MSKFIQLTTEDCSYLLNLIDEMDSGTAYTARQRAYTVPKLEHIAKSPDTKRLAPQDVDYLLELIEDDEAPEFEQQRAMTQSTLEEIRNLQRARAEEIRDIDEQRERRRARRQPERSLQDHFEHTS